MQYYIDGFTYSPNAQYFTIYATFLSRMCGAGCGGVRDAKGPDRARSNFVVGTLPIRSAWEAEMRARSKA